MFTLPCFNEQSGIAFIGKPNVCQLAGDEYRQRQYRLGETISSGLLPHLQLPLDEVLPL